MQDALLILPNGLQIKIGSLSVAEALALGAPDKADAPVIDWATLSRAMGILAATNKILAIKLVRSVTGKGLREAKDFVDGAERVEQSERERAAKVTADWRAHDVAAARRAEILRQEAEDERRRADGEIPF